MFRYPTTGAPDKLNAGHAKLSPSSAVRWMACPGSVARSEGIPDKGSQYADEGTAAHFLAAHCLTFNETPAQHKGRKIVLYRNDENDATGEDFEDALNHDEVTVLNSFIVGEEMVEEVGKYVDFVGSFVRSGCDLYVEQRLSIEFLTGEPDAAGTSDAVVLDYTNKELVVVDLKYGRGESVEAQDNLQLIMYALAAMKKFGMLMDICSVRTIIHQPRKGYVGEAVYTIEEMAGWHRDIAAGAARTRSSNPPITPGTKQCRWCRASGQCKEQDEWVQGQLGVQFEDLTTEHVEEVRQTSDVQVLSVKMSAIELIEDWCKAVRAAVEAALLSGEPVPGYKLVRGRAGPRKWVNEEDAKNLMKSMRLKVEEMYDMKLISPTTAEKLLKGQPKRWAKLQDLITQAEGGLSVAPESDKRPAVVPEAVTFEDTTHEHLL